MIDRLPKRLDALDTIQILAPDGRPLAVLYAQDLQAAGYFTTRVALRAGLQALVTRGALVHLGEWAFQATDAGAALVEATSARWDKNRATRSRRLAGMDDEEAA